MTGLVTGDWVRCGEEHQVLLVDPWKVLMHINLGFMKQSVITPDKESAALKYPQDSFPKLSEAIQSWCLCQTTDKEDPWMQVIPPRIQLGRRKWPGTVSQWFKASWAIRKTKTMQSWLRFWWRTTAQWAVGCLSESISLMLILRNSRRIWECTRTNIVSASTRIYWTLNAVNKNNIRRTWYEITIGGCFVKVMYNIIVNLKNCSLLSRLWSFLCNILV